MFSYSFTNLLGAPFESSQAHMVFDKPARCLYTPTSNRVACYRLHTQDHSSTGVLSRDLLPRDGSAAPSEESENHHHAKKQKNEDGDDDLQDPDSLAHADKTVGNCGVYTLPFEARVDVSWFCVRSDNLLAISIDAHGQGLILNLVKQACVVNRIQFKSSTSSENKRKWESVKSRQHAVTGAAFSPDDRFFAVAIGRTIQIWHSPEARYAYQLRLHRSMTLHQQTITSLTWSPDSTHLVTGSLDCTVRLWRVKKSQLSLSSASNEDHPASQLQASQQALLEKKRRRKNDRDHAEGGERVDESSSLVIREDSGGEECQRLVTISQKTSRHQVESSQEDEKEVEDGASSIRTGDEEFLPVAFVSHKHPLRFVCFSVCLTRIVSVNRDGGIVVWKWIPKNRSEEGHLQARLKLLNAPQRSDKKDEEETSGEVTTTGGATARGERREGLESRQKKRKIRKSTNVARVIHPGGRLLAEKLLEEREMKKKGGEGAVKKEKETKTGRVVKKEYEGEEDDKTDEEDENEEDAEETDEGDSFSEDDDEKEETNDMHYTPEGEEEEGRKGGGRRIGRSASSSSTSASSSSKETRSHLSIINYMRGIWKTETKAFCSASSSSSSYLDGRVTHACTNITPYYQSTYASSISSSSSSSFLPAQYLLVGFAGGVFQLYELPSLSVLCKLSLGLASLDALALSIDGEWIAALGIESQSLIVWEWRSESYVLRQQSHAYGLRCVCFSPSVDGALSGASRIGAKAGSGGHAQQFSSQSYSGGFSSSSLGLGGASKGIVATGGVDGRVKLFESETGYCFCTFTNHMATVTEMVFSPTGNAIFTASLDGTIRGYDLLRYRQFRVFTARPGQAAGGFGSTKKSASTALDDLPTGSIQFSCLAIDSGGELLVAGGQGSCFSVFVWSVQTGKLVDELTGHEGPVAAVRFHPHHSRQGVIVTGSWDKKIKVWDLYARRSHGGAPETFEQPGGVLCLDFDPRGTDLLAVGGEGGYVVLWDTRLGSEEGIVATLDVIRDIQGGRRSRNDRRARNNFASKEKKQLLGNTAGLDLNVSVDSLSFSSSGSLLLVGSHRCVCTLLYEARTGALLAKFPLTRNRLLDGIFRELNSRFITDAGDPLQEYDLSDEDDAFIEGARERQRIKQHHALPGVQKGELASKNSRLFLVHDVAFSSDSRNWAVATSQGLYIYSVNLKSGMYASFGGSSSGLGAACGPPPLLTANVTTGNICRALSQGQYAKALIYSLVLNDLPTLISVYEAIPPTSVGLVCSSLAPALLPPLLFFLHLVLSTDIDVGSPHLQFHLLWLAKVLQLHMHVFQGDLAALWTGGGSAKKMKASGENKEEKKKTRADAAFDRLTSLSVDLRTLFLLILRQLQQHHSNLQAPFCSNLHTLSFINASIRNNGRISNGDASCVSSLS